MSARDEIRRYVSLLGDLWTPRETTDARVEEVYAAVRAEVLHVVADRFEAACPDGGGELVFDLCRCDSAGILRGMADEAGKDTRATGESTRAASPWQQAVDGLNALVDAGVPVHIEPDGHIANPAGDEHIEWDRAAGRWRLVHDDEAEGYSQPVIQRQLTEDNIAEVDDWLDRADVFAKPYVETVNGRLTVVGLRIGHRPDHVVARFGDTIVRHSDGTHTARPTEGGDADA
ncbi:hypothetical protein [Streptomyces sp. NPDC052496]|uniref:hypothetical protein n=1 Tax=Streptomyces sp. NPDC052496 TaxID=3154951 RepID=UPI003416B182